MFLSSLSMLSSLAVRGSEVLKGSLDLIPGNLTGQFTIPELGKSVTGETAMLALNNDVAIPAILLSNLVHPLNVVAPSLALDVTADHAFPAFRSGAVKAASIEALAPALGQLIGLASLDMSGTYLWEAGWTALAPELVKLTKLENLYLAVNDVPATGLANLDEIVGLTDLDLTATQIGEAGAVALAPVLGKLKELTSLSLHSNNVGDAGLIALAPMLGKLSWILSLNLQNNQLGDACIDALTLEMDKLTGLSSINLGSNKFSDAGQVALALELSKLRRLRFVNLG
ncbi:Leucine rich repeat-containing protein [Klebsormidium nitens]|uniref:Leucine rich repeat-containing protein n=1 Tax=Klebsormidium nitens TaxID=105231 RepID=A0A1Y1IP86_KLENI|nr:Leucine rich repeat-containing protein [Klebsormidium nitens]|eukprot:GAQ92463.1 Leucine rich repeat-containing protein [Klebsormidium nitens]